MQPLAIAGLLLDIVGAYVLGMSVFGRRPSRAQQEAQARFDFNVDLHLSLARQTADAKAGIALLLSGFAAQLVSAFGLSCDSPWVLLISIAVAAEALRGASFPDLSEAG